MLLYFVLIISCSILESIQFGITGYNCADRKSRYKTLSLLSSGDCDIERNNIVQKDVDVQLLMVQSYISTRYIMCHVQVKVDITQCRSWFFKSHLNLDSYSLDMDISLPNCQDIHRTKYFTEEAYKRVKIYLNGNTGYFRGTVIGSLDNGNCEGGYFISHDGFRSYENVAVQMQYNIEIKEGDAQVNIPKGIINFEDGVAAMYNSFHYFHTKRGTYHWYKYNLTSGCGDKTLRVIFQGKVSRFEEERKNVSVSTTYVIVSEFNSRNFFIDAKNPVMICGEKMFQSQQPDLFLIESRDGYFSRSWLKDDPSARKDTDMNVYFSMKISHAMHNVAGQINDMYHNFKKDQCLQNQKIHQNMLDLATMKNIDACYNIFQREGLVSIVRGNLLHIFECQPEFCIIRPTTTCQQELSVECPSNKNAFLSPKSRIIQEVPTYSDCNSVIATQYLINQTWYGLVGGRLTPVIPPETLDPRTMIDWEFKVEDSIATKGIYTLDEFNNFQNSIVDPINLAAEMSNVVSNYKGKQQLYSDMSLINVFSNADFKQIRDKIFPDFFSIISSSFNSFGTAVSALIGIVVIFRSVVYIFNNVINGSILAYVYGCGSIRMLACCFDGVTNILLNAEALRIMRNKKSEEPVHHDIESAIVTTQPENNKAIFDSFSHATSKL